MMYESKVTASWARKQRGVPKDPDEAKVMEHLIRIDEYIRKWSVVSGYANVGISMLTQIQIIMCVDNLLSRGFSVKTHRGEGDRYLEISW